VNTKNSLLVAQSFVVESAGNYRDYRDYLFCLRSNPDLHSSKIRLNIERGAEHIKEFEFLAQKYGLSNLTITAESNISWRQFMLEAVEKNDCEWVMPWPGDHIFISEDPKAWPNLISAAELEGVDAIAYGHNPDFEFGLDWRRLDVVAETESYFVINWGWLHSWKENRQIAKLFYGHSGRKYAMPPIPGFAIYRRALFESVLKSLPPNASRWQSMEYAKTTKAKEYKLLIPKLCPYRHVHGYGIEGLLSQNDPHHRCEDYQREILSWYLPSLYDWRTDQPSVSSYRDQCLRKFPYFSRYLAKKSNETLNLHSLIRASGNIENTWSAGKFVVRGNLSRAWCRLQTSVRWILLKLKWRFA
jgi:hypothetical protein